MARKLAITISGAVSLGTFESGVLFEVLDAVSQHNTMLRTQGLPERDRIEVDVLTGASAGGMTVSLAAQCLLFDGSSLHDPYNNPLYAAWVRDIDIARLLRLQTDERRDLSVFSSDLVESISRKYLTDRYTRRTDTPPAPDPHPALPIDRQLSLGLALSNLNGVDYSRATLSGGRFTYTEFEDRFLRSLHGAESDSLEVWEPIRQAAVACGAFPFAFRVQTLLRRKDEFPSLFLDAAAWGNDRSKSFSYTDGGLFQNQPLGMAKDLVESRPEGRYEAQSRGYLFISPVAKTSAYLPSSVPELDFKATLLHLLDAVYGQASFQDWAVAETVNDRLGSLDAAARFASELFSSGRLSPAAAGSVTGPLLSFVFGAAASFRTGRQTLEQAREQIARQYEKEMSRMSADRERAEAWRDVVLLLEVAAGLHEKEEMLIYDFVAEPNTLAGTALHRFGGFFDERFRKHDYDCGRITAQRRIREYAQRAGSAFSDLRWEPKPVDPPDPRLANAPLRLTDAGKRRRVALQFLQAAELILREVGVGVIVRKLVGRLLLYPRIKKLLSL